MKINIKNFRNVKQAEIETGDITVIGGRNFQGKSSIIQAVAGALSGVPVPYDGLKKNQASLLVRHGEPTGTVEVSGDNWSVSLAYPKAQMSTTGEPVLISGYDAGIDSLIDKDSTARAQALTELTGCKPTDKELTEALPDVDKETIAGLLDTITNQDWDATWNDMKAIGTSLKREWESVTNEKFGAKKASEWLPTGFTSAFKTEKELVEDVHLLKEFHVKAIQSVAVDKLVLDGLQETFKNKAEYVKRLAECESAKSTITTDLKIVTDELQGLTNPEKIKPVKCPHCGGSVEMVGSELKKSITDEEKSELAKVYTEQRNEYTKMKAELDKINSEISELNRKIEEANVAESKFKSLSNASKGTTTEAVENCKRKLEQAEVTLDNWRRVNKAKQINKQIQQQIEIVNVLAPTGLRQQKLTQGLEAFNKVLADICQVAGWNTVRIDDDMNFSMNAWNGFVPYSLLSESEKFRVRVALQLACSVLGSSSVIIVDGADILDKQGRLGLIKIVKTLKKKAIIGMTYNTPDDLPKIDKLGGVCYWVDAGECRKI